MRTFTIPCLLILFFSFSFCPLSASHIEVKDTIKGNTTWNYDTIKITGNIYLSENITLEIKAGTRIEFQGNYSFNFDGIIKAIGSPDDSIIFTINDTTGFSNTTCCNGGWKGMAGGNKGSQRFEYCIFEYVKNLSADFAISIGKIYGYNLVFQHNVIQNNYAKTSALYIGTGGIKFCTIRKNLCNGINTCRIQNSYIYDNLGCGAIIDIPEHMFEEDWWSVGCNNSIFERNKGFAIKTKSDNIYLNNNLIDGNDGGIYNFSGYPIITNNIIKNNTLYGAINISNSPVTYIFGNLIYSNSVQTNGLSDSIKAPINIYNTNNTNIINFYNNTICKNTGLTAGGIFLNNFITANVWNNILWENKSENEHKEAAFLTDQINGNHKLNLYSNVISNGIAALTINEDILADTANLYSCNPLFTNYSENNYSLTQNSPCINKGKDFEYVSQFNYMPDTDIEGKYRIICNFIELGAVEFIPDSLLIINLKENDSLTFCNNNYRSIYLRSTIRKDFWNWCTYRWQKDSINIEGANKMDLYIENPEELKLGQYTVIATESGFDRKKQILITNKLGEICSKSISIFAGSDTVITLKNVTNDSVSYCWYKNGKLLTDALQMLQFNAVQEIDEGFYYCIIQNDCNTTITDSLFLNVISACDNITARDTIINITACDEYDFNGIYLTVSGTYSDTVPSYIGCDSIITLNLTIPQIDTTVSVSNSGLMAIMANADYQWISCNSILDSFIDSTHQYFNPDKSGTYAVLITKDGCTKTSSCHYFAKTDLVQIPENNKIVIYPNPFSNSTSITSGNQSLIIDEVQLVNIIGEVVFTETNINSNVYNLNKANLKAGTYIAIVKTHSKIYRQSIIIN